MGRKRAVGILCFLGAILLAGAIMSLSGHQQSERAPVEYRPLDVPAGGAPEGIPAPPQGPLNDAPRTVEPVVPRTTIHGYVTVEGNPARGAIVCEYAALPQPVTTCDAEGGFALDVAASSFYRIRAWCGYSHAVVGVSHAQAIAGPVRIELEQLLFEKVSFVTRDGTAVSVAGRHECALFARQPVYESFFNVARYDISWMPPEVDVAALKENDLVYLTTKRERGDDARVIDFQGYEPVDIPVRPLPLQQWPQGREIVLTPDPDEAPAVPHRVVFPEAILPDGWADDPAAYELLAGVATPDGGTWWVTRAHPVFRVPRGTDVAIRALGDRASLPFSLRDEGEEVSVLVEWPRYAFLDLRYPVRHPDVEGATSGVTAWTEGTFAIGGRLIGPGRARVAYLLEGNCFVEISWWKVGERTPFSSWRLRAPMRLAAGLNAREVREDDVLAATPR